MIQTIEYLKSKFRNGMKPTENDFNDTFDTMKPRQVTAQLTSGAWDISTTPKATYAIGGNTTITITSETDGDEGLLIVSGEEGLILTVNADATQYEYTLGNTGKLEIRAYNIAGTISVFATLAQSSEDVSATAYITAENITTPTFIQAVKSLLSGVKKQNLWDDTISLHLFGGSGMLNAKNPDNSDSAKRLVVNNGNPTITADGIVFDGNDSLRMNIIPANELDANQYTYIFYLKNLNNEGILFGQDDVAHRDYFVPQFSGNAISALSSTSEVNYGANPVPEGLYIITRGLNKIGTLTIFQRNGVLKKYTYGAETDPNLGSGTNELFLGAFDHFGNAAGFINATLSMFWTIRRGLTYTEVQDVEQLARHFIFDSNRNFSNDTPVPATVPAGTTWATAQTIDDDGLYNGFPMICDTVGQNSVGLYKKAVGHAFGGELMLIRTYNGGRSWTRREVKVDGTPIMSAAHSIGTTPGGRIIIVYTDDLDANDLSSSSGFKIAYNDRIDENFTFAAYIPKRHDFIAISPIKMVVMPSGKLRFYYYEGNGSITSANCIESNDNGHTWAHKADTAAIFTHTQTSDVSYGSLGNWPGNEVSVCVINEGGEDETTKMIAIVRTAGSNAPGPFMHFKSADGGETWTTDLTLVNGVSKHDLFVLDNGSSPVYLQYHQGMVYAVTSVRSTTGKLKWIAATAADAFENTLTGWSTPTIVKTYNGLTSGAEIDYGYSLPFIANGHVYISDYDVSTQPLDSVMTGRRCLVSFEQID